MGYKPRHIFEVAFCLALAVTTALAQGRDLREENRRQDEAANDLRRYHAMLDAYATGDAAQSVGVMAADPAWDETRLRNLFQQLNGLADPHTPWTQQRHAVAAMLHTDVALKLSPNGMTPAAVLHIEYAGILLRLGLREHGNAFRGFAERWYAGVSAVLLNRTEPYVAERLLAAGRDRVRDSAVILAASGTLAELFATDYALAGRSRAPESVRAWTFPLDAVAKRRTGHLNDAEDWLRRAAGLNPGDELVRLHLGRVLAIRGKDDEAVKVLQAVQDQSKDDATVYLAGLFVAGLRVRQARFDDAAAAYRTALDRFPPGQAAAVGLSEVLQHQGNGDTARDIMRTLLADATGVVREPLWLYLFEPDDLVEQRLDAIREEARK